MMFYYFWYVEIVLKVIYDRKFYFWIWFIVEIGYFILRWACFDNIFDVIYDFCVCILF